MVARLCVLRWSRARADGDSPPPLAQATLGAGSSGGGGVGGGGGVQWRSGQAAAAGWVACPLCVDSLKLYKCAAPATPLPLSSPPPPPRAAQHSFALPQPSRTLADVIPALLAEACLN